MQNVLDKRSYDERLFDVDCSELLAPEEVITHCGAPVCVIPPSTSVGDPPVDVNEAGLMFSTPVINAAPLYYPRYKYTAAIGKVVQVRISGGVAPVTNDGLLCTIRFPLATSVNPQLEATVQLRLIDAAP